MEAETLKQNEKHIAVFLNPCNVQFGIRMRLVLTVQSPLASFFASEFWNDDFSNNYNNVNFTTSFSFSWLQKRCISYSLR